MNAIKFEIDKGYLVYEGHDLGGDDLDNIRGILESTIDYSYCSKRERKVFRKDNTTLGFIKDDYLYYFPQRTGGEVVDSKLFKAYGTSVERIILKDYFVVLSDGTIHFPNYGTIKVSKKGLDWFYDFYHLREAGPPLSFNFDRGGNLVFKVALDYGCKRFLVKYNPEIFDYLDDMRMLSKEHLEAKTPFSWYKAKHAISLDPYRSFKARLDSLLHVDREFQEFWLDKLNAVDSKMNFEDEVFSFIVNIIWLKRCERYIKDALRFYGKKEFFDRYSWVTGCIFYGDSYIGCSDE